MVEKGAARGALSRQGGKKVNCLCNLFDDNTLWIVIIALIILCCFCGNGGLFRTCG